MLRTALQGVLLEGAHPSPRRPSSPGREQGCDAMPWHGFSIKGVTHLAGAIGPVPDLLLCGLQGVHGRRRESTAVNAASSNPGIGPCELGVKHYSRGPTGLCRRFLRLRLPPEVVWIPLLEIPVFGLPPLLFCSSWAILWHLLLP